MNIALTSLQNGEWVMPFPTQRRPTWQQCLMALMLAAFSVVLERLASGRTGDNPYLYFAPGVIIATLSFAELAGLIYVAVTTLVATYAFLPPLGLWSATKWGPALVYGFSTAAAVLATGYYRRRMLAYANGLMLESERRRRLDAHAVQAAARAELAEARFKQSFENAAVAMSLVGTHGQWLAVNQALCDILGYTRDELMALPVGEITHPADRQTNLAQVTQLWAGELSSFVLEKRYVRKDGTPFWGRLAVSLVTGRDGAPLHALGVMEDISRMKAAQQALEVSEAELSNAQRLARIGNWRLDASTNRRQWSPMVYEILGRDPRLPPAEPAELLLRFAPEDREPLMAKLNGLMQTGQSYACDARVLRPDGQQVWVILRGHAHRRADGSPSGIYVGTIQDINERKQAELRLAQLNEELERRVAQRTAWLAQSNRDLDEFAYVVSHDLKEPLRGLSNYATFLREGYACLLEGEGLSYLDSMQRLTRRMDALIDGLLAFSRARTAELPTEPVALDAVVDNVLEDLKAVLGERRVRVIRSPLPSVRCNELRVREVFQNLISNAAKYNDSADKCVEIGASAADPPVFHVRDNGIGIATPHQEQVFRIFKRLHHQSQYGGGTGAGLTISQKIIERHGGRIWLESTPGQGTTFFFTLQGAA